jgi:hypothetical protein
MTHKLDQGLLNAYLMLGELYDPLDIRYNLEYGQVVIRGENGFVGIKSADLNLGYFRIERVYHDSPKKGRDGFPVVDEMVVDLKELLEFSARLRPRLKSELTIEEIILKNLPQEGIISSS